MPKGLYVIALIIVLIGLPTCPYWSYKMWYKKLEENSKNKDWKSF